MEIEIKELIKKLKRIGEIKFYFPKPRSEKNHIWKKIKEKLKMEEI